MKQIGSTIMFKQIFVCVFNNNCSFLKSERLPYKRLVSEFCTLPPPPPPSLIDQLKRTALTGYLMLLQRNFAQHVKIYFAKCHSPFLYLTVKILDLNF